MVCSIQYIRPDIRAGKEVLTGSFATLRMTPEEMNGLLIFGTHVTKNVAVLIFIAIVYGEFAGRLRNRTEPTSPQESASV